MPSSYEPSSGSGLSARDLPGLLAEPRRLRALAAIALGVTSPGDLPAAAGLTPKEAATALHRLVSQGLVVDSPQGLQVGHDRLRELAADGAPAPDQDASPLRPFVQGRRLLSLPAQSTRRRAVLAHVAEQTFEPGVDYAEPAVNALLGQWCEGGEVDHAALRRYLVEGGLMSRGAGVYRLGADAPEPGAGERYVQAMGLR